MQLLNDRNIDCEDHADLRAIVSDSSLAADLLTLKIIAAME